MKEEMTFCDTTINFTDNGGIELRATYDIAGELVHQITQSKESFWKNFCKNVCSRVISQYTYMGKEVSLPDFESKFEKAFKEETKAWDEL